MDNRTIIRTEHNKDNPYVSLTIEFEQMISGMIAMEGRESVF